MTRDRELHDRIRHWSGSTPPPVSAELAGLLAAPPRVDSAPARHRLRDVLLRAGLGAKILVAGVVMATATATAAVGTRTVLDDRPDPAQVPRSSSAAAAPTNDGSSPAPVEPPPRLAVPAAPAAVGRTTPKPPADGDVPRADGDPAVVGEDAGGVDDDPPAYVDDDPAGAADDDPPAYEDDDPSGAVDDDPVVTEDDDAAAVDDDALPADG